MNILSVIQDASTVIGLSKPTAVFGQSDDTSAQLAAASNETAAMVAFDSGHDWTVLKNTQSMAGDGITLAFDLPADYKRMLKKASLWASWLPGQKLTHYPDSDEWLGLKLLNVTPILPSWTMIGAQINIWPAVPNATTVQYQYLKNTIAKSSAGTPQVAFLADTDTFALSDRLLKLAFIYRWKQDRGQDYGEAMEDYQTLLGAEAGNDKGSSVLTVGQRRVPAAALAFPWSLGS